MCGYQRVSFWQNCCYEKIIFQTIWRDFLLEGCGHAPSVYGSFSDLYAKHNRPMLADRNIANCARCRISHVDALELNFPLKIVAFRDSLKHGGCQQGRQPSATLFRKKPGN